MLAAALCVVRRPECEPRDDEAHETMGAGRSSPPQRLSVASLLGAFGPRKGARLLLVRSARRPNLVVSGLSAAKWLPGYSPVSARVAPRAARNRFREGSRAASSLSTYSRVAATGVIDQGELAGGKAGSTSGATAASCHPPACGSKPVPTARRTERYKLGELLGERSDHVLLLTAHKGDPKTSRCSFSCSIATCTPTCAALRGNARLAGLF
jgi:hypothetical protein